MVDTAQESPRGLSDAEKSVLIELGVPAEKLTAEANAAALEKINESTRRLRAEEEASALSESDVAQLLGLGGEDAVRARHDSGELYAITTADGERRFPRWQFHKRGLLPHLSTVLRAVPRYMSSFELGVFMTLRTEAFTGHVRDRRSPVQWLVEGGDPALVVKLLEETQYN